MKAFNLLLYLILILLLGSCGGGVPKGLKVVEDFDSTSYLGTWYEIARFDHSFERNLHYVTASYSLRKDGGIDVVNKGAEINLQDSSAQKWKSATGRAYLNGSPGQGKFKVSFFRPFYGAYNILLLDKDYQWSVVTGSNRSYLWILSRRPTIDSNLKQQLLEQIESWGFASSNLIWVKH